MTFLLLVNRIAFDNLSPQFAERAFVYPLETWKWRVDPARMQNGIFPRP